VAPRYNKPLFVIAKNLLLLGGKLAFRVKYTGGRNIPKTGGLIIASNHQSHLDPPTVGMGVPRDVHFMAKQELATSPFLRWFLRSVGTIFVDRAQGREALAEAAEYLNAGMAIVIFPEGTRTRTGRIGPGKKGVAILAHRTGAAVVPACIVGADKNFPAGSKRMRFGRIIVHYGKPMTFYHIPEGEISSELVFSTTQKIMDAIIELAPPDLWPLSKAESNETKKVGE